MSVYLKITAPGASSSSTTYWVPTVPLSSFNGIPSETFTADKNWTFLQADFYAYLKSVYLFSGDVWVSISKKNSSSYTNITGEINPGSGVACRRSIISYIKDYYGDFGGVRFKFSSDLVKNCSYSSLSITYLAVPYTFSTFVSGSGSISYSHNDSNETAINLTANPSTGYKFVKWSNGSEEQQITFDPGQEGINQEFNLTAFFVPITYQINFHLMKNKDEEIEMQTLNCTYGNTYSRPVFEPLEYHMLIGWYKIQPENINEWYINNETLEFIGTSPDYEINSSISSDYCTEDLKIIDEYIYNIPYGYFINYYWIDSWGQEEEMFNLPLQQVHRYGETALISLIPSYPEHYIVDNENTSLWYLNTDKTELNTKHIIEALDTNNYNFYAFKTPLIRIIKLKPNNEIFGSVKPIEPTIENWFLEEDGKTYYTYLNEGDTVNFEATPKNYAYFDNWSHNVELSNSIQNNIKVVLSKTYEAIFRSNQIYIGKNGVQGVYNGKGNHLTQINLGDKIISLKEDENNDL